MTGSARSYGRPRNHGCRISDSWMFDGLRTIVLENTLLRVVVLVDKGSDIVEFRYKPHDLDFLHLAPGGIRNPARDVVPAAGDSPYLDYFSGGWNEILPNGGPSVTYQGADLGQHGEISLLPWSYAILQDDPAQVAVRLWVRAIRTPFYVEKTLSMVPGTAALFIDERLLNEGGEPLDFMWGHHIAFGRPFLDEGVVIDAPARRIEAQGEWPNYGPRRFKPSSTGQWPNIGSLDGPAEDAGIVPPFGAMQAQEMAYLSGLEDGWYAITNPTRRVGFGIRFDPSVFRYIWYWQQMGNVASGFPWWRRLHTQALEPWSSYPSDGLAEAIRNGTALRLEAGGDLRTSLCAVAYEGNPGITGIDAEGNIARTK